MKKSAVEFLKQRLIKDQQNFSIYNEYINGVIDYLENQAKEMEKEQQGYSEEDMRECYEFAIENIQLVRNGYEWVTFEDWFEQFKK
jgi:hypothetical protein